MESFKLKANMMTNTKNLTRKKMLKRLFVPVSIDIQGINRKNALADNAKIPFITVFYEVNRFIGKLYSNCFYGYKPSDIHFAIWIASGDIDDCCFTCKKENKLLPLLLVRIYHGPVISTCI